MPSSALVVATDGRIGLAKVLANMQLYLAIGNLVTTTPWTVNDTPPNFSTSAVALENEITRRQADLIQYLVSDAGGDIVTDTNERYSASDTPTNILMARFLFFPPAVQDTIYQVGLFINTTPNMAKGAMTFAVNHVGGYAIGANQIQIDTVSGGTLGDLLPVKNPKTGFGRTITIAAQTYRITDLDAASSIITISPALVATLADNAALSTPAISAIPAGQKQLAYPTEVFDPGQLLLARNISPQIRNPGSRMQLDLIWNI